MPNAPELVFEDANRAYYNPIADKLNMPAISQFETAEDIIVRGSMRQYIQLVTSPD